MNRNGETGVRIGAVGTANPPFSLDQERADDLLTQHYQSELRPRSLDVMHRIFEHPSIERRYLAVDDETQLLSLKNEDPDKRMDRFAYWAVELSASAVKTAADRAGIGVDQIDTLVINTCTGYLCPGIGTYVLEKLGLSPDVRVYDLVGSGCGGAVPNIQVGESLVASRPGSIAVCVSVEICTATFEMGDDMSLIVSNAIFGDGAAAVVLWDRPVGPSLVRSKVFFEPSCRDDVRYIYKNGRLHNRLSSQLPGIIGKHVPKLIQGLLEEQNLSVDDIMHWAIHPGGAKMLEAIGSTLKLNRGQLELSASVLRDFGNMSSPTCLFTLERILSQKPKPGEWVLMVGYGAGLSVYGYLART